MVCLWQSHRCVWWILFLCILLSYLPCLSSPSNKSPPPTFSSVRGSGREDSLIFNLLFNNLIPPIAEPWVVDQLHTPTPHDEMVTGLCREHSCHEFMRTMTVMSRRHFFTLGFFFKLCFVYVGTHLTLGLLWILELDLRLLELVTSNLTCQAFSLTPESIIILSSRPASYIFRILPELQRGFYRCPV